MSVERPTHLRKPTCAGTRGRIHSSTFVFDRINDQLLFSLGSTRLFFPLVKSRINARIRRNSNRLFILYNDHIVIEVGFVRIIFAIFPPRAHQIAAVRDRVRIAHVA